MRNYHGLRSFAAVAAALLVATAAPAAATVVLEVRYGPDARVLAYPVAGGGAAAGFETIIVHNIAVFNPSSAAVRVSTVRIDAAAKGTVTRSVYFDAKELDTNAALWSRRQSQGRLKTHELLFQVAKLVADRTLAPSTELGPNNGLLIARTPMLVRSQTDELIITAEGTASDGKRVNGELRVPIVRDKSKNDYRFPLCGRWLIAVGPNLNGHHRWGASQEFAIDIGKVGADMNTHVGDGSRPEMYHAFGSLVMAVADGEVVAIEANMQDGQELARPGETPEEAHKRLASLQESLIASGFRNVIGNHAVIRHPNGEYSLYAHLKANSLRVRVGDKVVQGAVLAELGHSGNSTEPHLHFSIHDGPDPLTSRSLPFRFDGLRFWDEADGGTGVLNSGQIVEAGGC